MLCNNHNILYKSKTPLPGRAAARAETRRAPICKGAVKDFKRFRVKGTQTLVMVYKVFEFRLMFIVIVCDLPIPLAKKETIKITACRKGTTTNLSHHLPALNVQRAQLYLIASPQAATISVQHFPCQEHPGAYVLGCPLLQRKVRPSEIRGTSEELVRHI